MAERLHKVLARAGLGSRRACEDFVRQGRVKVDGETVTRLGVVIDPETQRVSFDDEPVRLEAPGYFLVYKPRGVICTTKDQFGRRSVVDLVRQGRGRLFPVGRLEEDSEGLILVTNDGELANSLASRGSRMRYTYFVKLRGELPEGALDRVRAGVWLSDGKTAPMRIRVLKAGKKVTTLLVSPEASQHRQLRRAFARVGAQVDKVVRTEIGPLTTMGLKKGDSRKLSREEVERLRNPEPEDLTTRLRPPARRPGRGGGGAPVRGKGKGGRGGRSPLPKRGPAPRSRRRKDEDGPRRRVIGP